MPALVDACPGLLDLHEARDGMVARVRIPGGYLSRRRLSALATLSEGYGDGQLDLTSRGNVQVRGIAADAVEALSARAAELGLLPSVSHDRARNITASPLEGLGGRPSVRRVVDALDHSLLGTPQLANLPGRFLFAVDDGTGGASLGHSDLGLICVGSGVELVIAACRTGIKVTRKDSVCTVVGIATEAVAAGLGTTALHVVDLPGFAATVAEQLGGSLGEKVLDVPDRLSPGVLPDATAVVAAAELSRLSSEQLRLVGALLATSERARLGAAGRIVIPTADSEVALEALAAGGLVVADTDPRADVTACSGVACARSLGDVRAWAQHLPGVGATHWVGCDRKCGLPADATAVVAVDAKSAQVGATGQLIEAAS